jgi:small redox-active disulfide protein 2
MIDVKVLGKGCARCHRLEQVTRDAAQAAGIEIALAKITDLQQILAYEVLATPGLVVDGKLVCSGRIPTKAEVEGWLRR